MAFKPKQDQSFSTEPKTGMSTQASPSYLGKTIHIKGNIISDEDVTVEGKLEGTISVKKTLTIGKNGSIKADVDANAVKIDGISEGNIKASRVEISSQGECIGNIFTERIMIADGARIRAAINLDQKEGDKK